MRYLRWLTTFVVLVCSIVAHAQQRGIDPNAEVGTLQMSVFPEALINGEKVRFGAGARILNRENRIVLPVGLTEPVRIAYLRDFQGLIHKAWLITDEEARAILEAQRDQAN